MPEIKHNFTAGKMNKDLDERLVRNGEYRDALNIQVRTTEGDASGEGNAGTVQNIEGNSKLGIAYETVGYDGLKTKFVGSIANEKTDKAYFFAAAPVPTGDHGSSILHNIGPSDITIGLNTNNHRIWMDSIIEVDTNLETSRPIFQDIFAVTADKYDLFYSGGILADSNDGGNIYPSTSGYTSVEVLSGNTQIRVGMKMYAQKVVDNEFVDLLFADATSDNPEDPGVEIVGIQSIAGPQYNETIILAEEQTADLSEATHYKFIHPERVLNFDYHGLISSINIVDDLLFYTDGKDEPKKINITRSKAGTSTIVSTEPNHTKLYVTGPPPTDALVEVTEVESLITSDIQKDHITVIRKKPTTPPHLFMKVTDRQDEIDFILDFAFSDVALVPTNPIIGTQRTITNSIFEDLSNSIFVGDVWEFTDYTSNVLNPVTVRAKIIEIDGDQITFEMLFVDEDLTALNTIWNVQLEQNKPLFETKFGRFAYRYKYEDNEHSAFSPWSELAFLPGGFLYTPSKGFNDGMANNLRQLIIKNFIPDDSIRPSDVKEVDLLWKTTDNANVYVIKTITREISNEWEGFDINNTDGNTTGTITVTSEMIHRTLPSTQIVRTWDNVPKTAVAQEVTGSRIVYGNYTQGYDITQSVGLKQLVLSSPKLFGVPDKSIKSMRKYKFGMVFGDKYGRETPVIANGYVTDNNETVSEDISVEKNLAAFVNKFTVKQNWTSDPSSLSWVDYIKYYVKAPANEYYNLVMDRWYDAKDGNIWISFPSVDRNKIDEETYLILKNEHGTQIPVEEEARYKVIAIKNEAPDYIKLDHRKFYKLELSRRTVYGTDSDVENALPTGLVNNNKINILSEQWLEESIKNHDFKGIPKARIVAEWTSNGGAELKFESPWHTVSKVTEKLSANANYDDIVPGVHLKEAWTSPEVNAYNHFANVLGYGESDGLDITEVDGVWVDADDDYDLSVSSYIQYYLELKDEVVENKPEFDGRFFVKIEKDDILSSKLTRESSGNWIVTELFESAYICTKYNGMGEANADATYDNNPDYTGVTWNNLVEPTYLGTYNITDDNISATIGVSDAATENYLNWWAGPWDEPGERVTSIFIDEMKIKGYWYWGEGLWEAYLDGYIDDFETTIFESITSSLVDFGAFKDTYYWSLGWSLPILNGLFNRNGDLSSNKSAVWFSVLKEGWSGDADVAGQNPAQFKSLMQTVGTTFRFRNDPNQNVYKVERVKLEYSLLGVYDFTWSNSIEGYALNFGDADEDSGYARRSTFMCCFRRLDSDGGVIENSGVDVSEWDPRGGCQHNGLGAINIDIVDEQEDDELSGELIASSAACWETEPKEDVDIDLYYEASGCIPLVLQSHNIQSYTNASKNIKNASNVRVYKRRDSNLNVLETYPQLHSNTSALHFVYENLGNDGVKIKRSIDDVESDATTHVDGGASFGIAISDIVAFEHPNGLVTKAEVIDHYEVDSYNSIDVPKPSTRYTDTVVIGADPSQLQLSSGAIEAGVSVGMQVVAPTILQTGTFITSVNMDTDIVQIYPSALVFNQEVAGVKLIEVTGIFKLDKNVWEHEVDLAWFNCYTFGNGVESDRIRDDFNAPRINNGERVSTTFLEYGAENISSGMIYSGLYNSISSVNNLNEFNMGEKISKELNPAYGSIQAMKTRDTNVVVFTEDKVLKVLSNKDAVFNADGSPNLTATHKVLGTAIPFSGDYGISKNPESLAVDSYRMYFTDKQRGAVLRLSQDGLTPISNVSMKSYFRENLKLCDNLIGTFDTVNGEYNLTLAVSEAANACTTGTCPTSTPQPITVSFNEAGKGWVSFKSFVPSTGVSVNGKYLTAPYGYLNGVNNIPTDLHDIWVHYDDNAERNTFYGQSARASEIQVFFNDLPDIIKSFKSINYEGSQGRVNTYTGSTESDAAGNTLTVNDGEYYNLQGKTGWYVDSFNTDLQQGEVPEFINKENKWFNFIKGNTTTLSNLDANELSTQGIGFPLAAVEGDPLNGGIVVIAEPMFPGGSINAYNGWTTTTYYIAPAYGGTPPYTYIWQFHDSQGNDLYQPSINQMTVTSTGDINNYIFNAGGYITCTITDSSTPPLSTVVTGSLIFNSLYGQPPS